ncbi:MAG TPA: TIGR01841 family phasin [Paucimonas sp.]|nr:TIGR01841 family phasin [Paucimonas sp.]
MFAIPEQLSNATKANLNAQLNIFAALSGKALESVEKVVDLNMSVARASLEESASTVKQLLTARDPQEFFTLSAAQVQPAAHKAVSYGRHLAGIASNAQAEFTKTADEQITETNRKVIAFVEDVARNAPAGSESAIALVKTVVGNANAGFEQLSKATKQAMEAVEANLATAADQFVQATEKTAVRAKKAAA